MPPSAARGGGPPPGGIQVVQRFSWIVAGVFVGSLAPLRAQVTERESVSTGGGQSNGQSLLSGLTPDGRYVVFESEASNLVPNDTNGYADVFVHDRWTSTTEIVSVSSSGALGNRDSGTHGVAISADGRYVAFTSLAYNLVVNDGDLISDVFVRDRRSGTTEIVS